MKAEQELFEQLALLEKRRNTNRLEYYEPYPFQKKFHNAKGHLTDIPARQRALCCANKVGKTYCGAMEVAIHATGKYPSWWFGTRYLSPPAIMVAGLTNESVVNLCQKELFGEPSDESQLGTGAIPKTLVGKRTRKAGVPNAWDSVFVKHTSGRWSKILFRAYEQGWEKFMGFGVDLGWLDEEPPADVWSQMIRSTLATKGKLFLTFTPENGYTEVVLQFMSDLKKGQALITATWDDAKHMSDQDTRNEVLATFRPHEREMREKGIPLLGSGLVFQVTENDIRIDEVKIADWWPRIAAIDFGIDHKFAAVWIAWDRDSDTLYVYDVYAQEGKTIPDHVSRLKSNGDWIPVVWPHDGLNREKSSGEPLAELYRKEGANMMRDQFSNPPAPGLEEGKGGNSVEYGLEEMLHRMQAGRFKVLAHLKDFWDEFRMYHRKDGKIVALNDDVMSATRYAALSLRHAITKPVRRKVVSAAVGITNW